MATKFLKKTKKTNPELFERIIEACEKDIAADPFGCDALNGILEGLRSYHLMSRSVPYRIVYEIDKERKGIIFVGIGMRKRIYKDLEKSFK